MDILIITETKLDDTFTNSQFKIEGFSYPYRLDRTKEGEGIMLLIREDIPSKILTKHSLPVDIEAIMVEINLRKTKFLLLATYHPPPPPQANLISIIVIISTLPWIGMLLNTIKCF